MSGFQCITIPSKSQDVRLQMHHHSGFKCQASHATPVPEFLSMSGFKSNILDGVPDCRSSGTYHHSMLVIHLLFMIHRSTLVPDGCFP
eukprot:530896-Pelagomonas_calceolata.AAC.1